MAYNDREWRKTYPQIDFILDTGKSYQETKDRKKPHIVDEKYRLNFELNDISIVVVENEKNIDELKQCLDVKFGKNEVDKRLLTQNLKINTKKKLIEQGF
ncbi:MAG: hypothetical protein IPI22_14910 [Bacteroidetes bacterium]|nr:hypothetical protein [Bacteroidota bacterium]